MSPMYIGSTTIRETIIPHAVSWFTGEACESEDAEYDESADAGADEDVSEDDNDDEE